MESPISTVPYNLGLRVKKGAWSAEEDHLLTGYIHDHGEGNWHLIPKITGLNRCRKSCRLRWLNYLSPNIKRGIFDKDEINLIVRLHKLLGNRWSLIAGRIPGRTSNGVKNFWNTNLKKIQKSTCYNEKVDIIPKFDLPSKVKVIRPQHRTFSETLFSLKNKQVMIEPQTDLIENKLDKTKIIPYQNFSMKTLHEHEQGNTSSIWSLNFPYNEVGVNILNEDIPFQQRDDYLSNSICFNWETGLETDNIALELETLPQVDHDWDDLLENMDIWNLLRDEQII